MLSQTAEYALRAMVCLAETPGIPRTVQELAGLAQVPQGYLAKVMQSLVRAGLVRSQRGLNGGFTLQPPVGTLTVLDVINAVDPLKRIHKCPIDRPEHAKKLCPLHKRLDEALALIEGAFRQSVLADLLEGPGGQRPLRLAPRSGKHSRRGRG